MGWSNTFLHTTNNMWNLNNTILWFFKALSWFRLGRCFSYYSLISKYFWCTGSYSSHVTLRNLFLSLDPESVLSSWTFGSLEKEQNKNTILENIIMQEIRKRQEANLFPWILFVYKAHLSFRQPIRTFIFVFFSALVLLFSPFFPPSPASGFRDEETNDEIPKAFFNFEALQGLFWRRVTVVVSIPALLRPVTQSSSDTDDETMCPVY